MAIRYGFRNSISNLFSRYVDFDGQSDRSEYWWPVTLLLLLNAAFYLWLRTRLDVITVPSVFTTELILLVMMFSYAILIVPFASLHVRRYRDAGISPWLLLVTVFVPLVGLYLAHDGGLLTGAACTLLVVNFTIATLPTRRELAYH